MPRPRCGRNERRERMMTGNPWKEEPVSVLKSAPPVGEGAVRERKQPNTVCRRETTEAHRPRALVGEPRAHMEDRSALQPNAQRCVGQSPSDCALATPRTCRRRPRGRRQASSQTPRSRWISGKDRASPAGIPPSPPGGRRRCRLPYERGTMTAASATLHGKDALGEPRLMKLAYWRDNLI